MKVSLTKATDKYEYPEETVKLEKLIKDPASVSLAKVTDTKAETVVEAEAENQSPAEKPLVDNIAEDFPKSTGLIPPQVFMITAIILAMLGMFFLSSQDNAKKQATPLTLSAATNQLNIAVANGEFGAYGCHESIVKKADNAFRLSCTGFGESNANSALNMLLANSADMAIVKLSDFQGWRTSTAPDASQMLTVLGERDGEPVVLASNTVAAEAKHVLFEQYIKALYGVKWGEEIDLLINSNLSPEYLPMNNTANLLPLSEGLALLKTADESPLPWLAAIAGINEVVLPVITPDSPNSNTAVKPNVPKEFEELNDVLMKWIDSPLSKIISMMMIIVGIAMAVVQQNLMAGVAGIAGGLMINTMPAVLKSILLSGV